MKRSSLAQRSLGKARQQAYSISPAAKARLEREQEAQLAQQAPTLPPDPSQVQTVEQAMAEKMTSELVRLEQEAIQGI